MTEGNKSGAFGVWERIGNEPYELDATLPAVRYRWHAPERFGPFSIDFQCTETHPDRRFYPVEVLPALQGNLPADDFVERVCRFGIGLLPEMEESCRILVGAADPTACATKELPCGEALAFLFALFESRRAGHARVTRRFNRWDDFADTTASVHRPESLVPGVPLPKREPLSSGMDVIRLIQERLRRPDPQLDTRPGLESRLDSSPLRTSLDQVLVQGVFRDTGRPGAQSFQQIVGLVAPALIDGIEVENDSMYLAEHQPDFRHFITRLVKRYQDDPAGFGGWLRQESEKGFTRLLPGFKRLARVDQEKAREKGRRFYRRLLWTAYEAMSRCYGAVALWVWVSFCRSGVVAPSVEEERAFRWYNAPVVCTGGLPLWFFGPNLLRWVLEPFIKCVWGLRPDQEFDALTRLIGLYGQLAADRRQVDANMKRRAKALGGAGLRTSDVAEQYEEMADGRNVKLTVPTVQAAVPRGESDTTPLEYTESTICPCGGRMVPAVDVTSGMRVTPTVTEQEILVLVECVECGKELTFRTSRP